jgi:hypothetical protein
LLATIPPELVERAFGRTPFPESSGLFYVVNEREPVVPQDRITMIRLHDPERNDAQPAAQFIIGGFHLLLAFGPFLTDNRTFNFESVNGSMHEVRLLKTFRAVVRSEGRLPPAEGHKTPQGRTPWKSLLSLGRRSRAGHPVFDACSG